MSNYVALLRSLTAVTAVISASLREARKHVSGIITRLLFRNARQAAEAVYAETACLQ